MGITPQPSHLCVHGKQFIQLAISLASDLKFSVFCQIFDSQFFSK